MASNDVPSVLERLKGARWVEEHTSLVRDHMHTDYVVLQLIDGSRAYVRFRREKDRCETKQIDVIFESGEVYRLTGDEKYHFEDKFWDVIE
jgi:hypothetical protein